MREKLKNIELLRFIFIVQIMIMHLTCSTGLLKLLSPHIPLIKYLHDTTKNGYVGVDYFFIIAGFFVFYTFRNTRCWEFVIRKIKRLLPTMLAALMLILALSASFPDIKFDWYRAFHTITFTASFMPYGGGYFWFVGPLFWASIFYFYTFKYFDKKYLNIIYLTMIICFYALLINDPNDFGNARPQLYNFLNMGMLRAFAGMGIGYFIAMFYMENSGKFKNRVLPFPYRVLFTFIEAILLLFIVYYGSLSPLAANPMMAILVFIALFVTFLLKQGYISRLLDNNFSASIGKYVYTIYVMETVTHHYLRHLIPSMAQKLIDTGGGYCP